MEATVVANEVTLWDRIMASAMKMPMVQVNRREFLRSNLRQYCKPELLNQAIENPVKVLPRSVLNSLAENCINNHLIKVSALSFASGLPGGFAILATIPADVTQYFWHTLVLAQKLAYIYGFPDLCDENGNLNEFAQSILTMFIGVMMGVTVANGVIKRISQELSKKVAKQIAYKALTKTWYYPVVKEVAKKIGINVTKGSFSKSVSKIVPLLGGVVSGGLTYFTFSHESKRLHDKLAEMAYSA